MTDDDKAVSFHVLRQCLFREGWTSEEKADEEALRLALLRLLHSHISADGIWAALHLLNPQ